MKYFWCTVRHKWFVLIACLRLNVPIWKALTHDLSKFTWKELPYYNRQFYGDKGDPAGWSLAWHHHIIHNPHHPEHWTYIDRKGEQMLPMPWPK